MEIRFSPSMLLQERHPLILRICIQGGNKVSRPRIDIFRSLPLLCYCPMLIRKTPASMLCVLKSQKDAAARGGNSQASISNRDPL
jgi:hypothetical protein